MKELIPVSEIKQYEPKFNELINSFTRYLDVSPNSTKSYLAGVKRFIRFMSDNGITTPTRDTVIMYKKALIEKYSANTVAISLSSIRKFFGWLESEGLYANITAGIKSPKIDSGHKKDAFTAIQLKTILSKIDRKCLEGKRDYAIFALMSACGLRTIEIQRANVCDIRNTYGEYCLFIQGKGKTSKSDFVKLTEPIIDAIRDYLNARGEVSEDEPLFASCSKRNRGGRLTTQSISRICKNAMRMSGFNSPRLTAHSLRHSAVTLALLGGLSLQEVSRFARHSNISVTLIYAHDLERLRSKCEGVISSAIFN